MKIISRNLFSAVFLLLASILIGCSGNESTDAIDNVDDTATKGVHFSLTEPDFSEEKLMGSRNIREKMCVTDTTYLDDDVLGEISISKEQGNISTRANIPAKSNGMINGKYTVLAYDASGTLKGKLNATVTGGKFSSKDFMILEPASYTFICLNDKVDYSGGIISVSRDNAATARIGRTVMNVSGEACGIACAR